MKGSGRLPLPPLFSVAGHYLLSSFPVRRLRVHPYQACAISLWETRRNVNRVRSAAACEPVSRATFHHHGMTLKKHKFIIGGRGG